MPIKVIAWKYENSTITIERYIIRNQGIRILRKKK